MSLLKRLFGGGGGSGPAVNVVEYEGFRITPQPEKEGAEFRIGALIEGEVDGEPKSHHMIRADRFSSRDEAMDASVRKAKQMIDQLGARLFR